MRTLFIAFILALSTSAQARKLQIHFQENPPYGWTGEDGKPIGAMIEVLKRVCDKLKHECTMTGRTPIARSEELMKKGESDVTIGIAVSKEREEYMWFPPMLSEVDYTFFTKKGEASQYKKIEDIKGKSVAVHIASATGRDLVRIKKEVVGGDLKIIEETNSELPVTKLAHDRYPPGTMVYCTRPICKQLAKIVKADIEPVNFIGKVQNHGISLSKKSVSSEDFEAIKTAIVAEMKTEGIKKIFADYEIPVHPALK